MKNNMYKSIIVIMIIIIFFIYIALYENENNSKALYTIKINEHDIQAVK